MSVPPAPPPLEQLGRRPFAFYPAILGIQHNEWIYDRATWSEVLVHNAASGEEVWVPRRVLGEVSAVEDPVLIVGLRKEMEYKAGRLWPVERRVIEMPRAVNDVPRAPSPAPAPLNSAPVVGIRLSEGTESRVWRMVLGGVAIGLAACVLVVSLYRGQIIGNRTVYAPVMQNDPGLSARDDYWAVVRTLGAPADDRWQSDQGEIQYRLLAYPRLGLYIILMGRNRADARYIGAVDRDWKPTHTVQLPGNINSLAMLRQVRRF